MLRFEGSNRCAIINEKPFCIIKILFLLLASMWSEKNGSLATQGEISYYVFIISFLTPSSPILFEEHLIFYPVLTQNQNKWSINTESGSLIYVGNQ